MKWSKLTISMLEDSFPSLPSFNADDISHKDTKCLIDYISTTWGMLIFALCMPWKALTSPTSLHNPMGQT